MNLEYYRGKRVLVTGHTGFKGAWLCKILLLAGARVTGYSLEPPTEPSLFVLAGLEKEMRSVLGDVRDYDRLLRTFREAAPELVFHLAAQPIVRESYADPRYTYETNVMGTVNVLECIRQTDSVKSAVIITTDKVYRNNEWAWGYRENDVLDGYDPYSNSKSCAELVTASYRRSFPGLPPISTARAGNVIGGGDFAKDRIIPDCVRAVQRGEPIAVRNPHAVRPWQHVLEPLFAYLMIAKKQSRAPELAWCYNIGPEECDCVTTGELVSLFCKKWGEGAEWRSEAELVAPHEAGLLKLDCNLMRKVFGWKPKWHIEQAVEWTVRLSKLWLSGEDIKGEMEEELMRW